MKCGLKSFLLKNKYKVIFWIYLILLVLLVVIKFHGSINEIMALREYITQERENGNWNVNFEPFHSINVQIKSLPQSWAVLNLIGNFVPFIPFGYLLPLAYDKMKKIPYLVGTIILSIVMIETFQFFTKFGVFDIDDIILNTLGAITGNMIFQYLAFRKNRK